KFQGGEVRVGADVPPDLLGVVDAIRLDQQVDVILEFRPALINVGDVGARKLIEHLAAVRPQPGIHAQPEGRVGGQREQVRQEVAGAVHQLNGGFPVLHADVNVESENEI